MKGKQKLFFRILLGSLTRRASKVVIALLALSVGVTAAATLLNLTYDVESKMKRELRSYGANLIVIPKSPKKTMIEPRPEELISLSRTGEIVAVAPYLYTPATMETNSAADVVMVAGVRFEQIKRVNPYWQVEGRWAHTDDFASAMIGSDIARRFHLAIGDRFRLSMDAGRWNDEFVVTGIVTTGEAEDGQVFINLSVLQRALGQEGEVSLLAMNAVGRFERVERLARDIQRRWKNVEARPLRKIALAEGQILGKIKWMLLVSTTLILIISALCVMSTMMALIVERQREIGLMKALGARPGEILSLFLSEAFILAFLGGWLGYVGGVLCSQLVGERLFQAHISPRPEAIPGILGIALLTCGLAAYAPIRRALAIKPATVLRGE
ncbi:MAG: ABC transporter permease [Acidobacteria bacterium]|nr:MAG: ABC transporter permease [Acidobacteriota bacterium]